MSKYIAFHPRGFNKQIAEWVIKDISSSKLLDQGANYTLFSTARLSRSNLPQYFETTYLVIKSFDKDLTAMVRWLESNIKVTIQEIISNFNEDDSFRIGISSRLQDKSQYNSQISRLHLKLSEYGIKIEKAAPKYEILLFRNEEIGFIGIRLSKPRESSSLIQSGSIRKEIAAIAIRLSDPQSSDIFLDPMAGHGIIPIMRATNRDYKKIYAVDKDTSALIKKIKSSSIKLTDFEIIKRDISGLELDEKPNKIVIDPPWGYIEKVDSITLFYKELLAKITDISADKSIIIVMSSRKKELFEALQNLSDRFTNIESWESETSGKEISIFKITT